RGAGRRRDVRDRRRLVRGDGGEHERARAVEEEAATLATAAVRGPVATDAARACDVRVDRRVLHGHGRPLHTAGAPTAAAVAAGRAVAVTALAAVAAVVAGDRRVLQVDVARVHGATAATVSTVAPGRSRTEAGAATPAGTEHVVGDLGVDERHAGGANGGLTAAATVAAGVARSRTVAAAATVPGLVVVDLAPVHHDVLRGEDRATVAAVAAVTPWAGDDVGCPRPAGAGAVAVELAVDEDDRAVGTDGAAVLGVATVEITRL